MDVQALLRAARQRRGLSQRQVAELAGVPQSVVARAESRTSNPSWRTVERLLAASGAAVGLEQQADTHDLTLLSGTSTLTPEERIDRLLALVAFADELRAAR